MFTEHFQRGSTCAEHFTCIISFNPTHMKGATLRFIGWRSSLPKVEAQDHYYMLIHMSHLVDS